MDTLATGRVPTHKPNLSREEIAFLRARRQRTEEDTGDLVNGKPDKDHVREMRAREPRYALHNVRQVLKAHAAENPMAAAFGGLSLREITECTLHRESTVNTALQTLRDMGQARYVRGNGWRL